MDISTHEFLENMSIRFRDLECGGNREAARSVTQDFVETIFSRTYSRNAHDAKGKCAAEKHRLEDILPITEESASVEELVKAFDVHVVRKGLPQYHPGFMGMIPGSGNYIYALAQHLASVSQVLVVNNFSNPGACKIEKTVLDWVSSLLGFPAESRGVFTSGTSMGTVLAFSAAREDRLANLSRLDRAVVYMTNQCHFSNARSLNVTGMRACPRRTVPVDSHQRMDPNALEKLVIQDKENGLLPFLVVGSLGTTNFGAVDPIDEIGQVSRRHGLWFHVDGAYGGFFLASKIIKAKCKGIEFADSITLDCHKGLSAPFGTSVVLVRDGQTLKHSMEWDDAPFLPDPNRHDEYEPINYTFEVTRPFRGFPVWFALRHLGTKLIEDHFEEKLILANHAYVSLNAMADIDVFTQPDLSIVAFRFVATGFNDKDEGNKLTLTLLRFVNSSGTVFLSSTRVQGIEYIRLCVLSFRSHLPEVNTALELIREKADWMSKNIKRSQTRTNVSAISSDLVI